MVSPESHFALPNRWVSSPSLAGLRNVALDQRASRVVRGATPAGRLLLFGVAGVNLRRFPHLAVVGEGTGKIRSIALKSEADLGAAGLW